MTSMIDDEKVDSILAMQAELSVLEHRARELSACLTAMTLVGSSLDLDVVLDRAIASAMEVMNAEASSIMLLDEQTGELYFKQAAGSAAESVREIRIPRGHGIAGLVAETGEPVVVADAQKDPRHFRGADDRTGFVTRSILAVPLKVRDRIVGVAEAINKREGTFSDDDLPLFSAYASLAAVAIENARMHHRLLRQELIEREIDIARQIQAGMQGPPSAHSGRWCLNALTAAARDVGGDFYDWLPLGDGRILLAVGDVSGKGIPAAMLMSNAITRIRAEAARISSPAELAYALNRDLCAKSNFGLFVTLFIALLDNDGVLRYANAGHHLPLLVRDGVFVPLSKAGGPPVAILSDASYEEQRFQLEPNDYLVFYTDGVTEAQAGEGRFFGPEGLEEVVRRCAERPLSIPARVRHAVEKFETGSLQTDDLTIGVAGFSLKTPELDLKFDHLTADNLGDIRAELEQFLGEIRLSDKDRTKIVLSIDEALTNIIRHAYGGEGGPVSLRCWADQTELNFEIRDSGCGYIPNIPDAPRTEIRPGGLGLIILKEVMTDVRFESAATGGCILRMKKILVHCEQES